MKRMKKLLAVMLAAIMVMSMGMSVFADTTYTITINNSESGHTYEAYQLFTGDLSGDDLTGYTLSNIKWGTGVNASDLVTALKSVDNSSVLYGYFSSVSYDSTDADASAKAIANILVANNSTNGFAEAFAAIVGANLSATATKESSYSTANSNYTISELAAGYYFVKDKDSSLSGDTAYTSYILKVVANVSVDPKDTTVPTPSKTVTETNDSSSASATTGNVADYDVGDSVPFTLTATMPSDYGDYTVYKLTFHDTLSTGLTFNNTVTVTVTTGNATTTVTSGYVLDPVDTGSSVSESTNACTFEVQIADTNALKDGDGNTITVAADSVITVSYTATLTSSAVYNQTYNEMYLTYSNNPNESNGSSTGTSETVKVYVYDFSLTVNKVDGSNSNNPLNGAGFTLYKLNSTSGNYEEYNTTYKDATQSSTFTFSGLDAGTYKLVESATPGGYNTADDIYFVIVPTYDGNGNITGLDIQNTSGTSISGSGGTFTADYSTGVITTTIQNFSGSSLPVTGGIGTTMFYVVGMILVVGAAVILVTRRRVAR